MLPTEGFPSVKGHGSDVSYSSILLRGNSLTMETKLVLKTLSSKMFFHVLQSWDHGGQEPLYPVVAVLQAQIVMGNEGPWSQSIRVFHLLTLKSLIVLLQTYQYSLIYSFFSV